MIDINKITAAQVLTTYTGQAGACRCGCKGTYRCTAENAAINGKRRGYEVSQDEISNRSVNMVLNRLKHQHGLFPVSITMGMGDEIIIDAQIGNRDCTAYLIASAI